MDRYTQTLGKSAHKPLLRTFSTLDALLKEDRVENLMNECLSARFSLEGFRANPDFPLGSMTESHVVRRIPHGD